MTKTSFSKIALATIPAIVAVGSLATLALAQSLPNGEGKDMVEKICAGCHDLSPITEGVGFSRRDWDAVVESMISMGADIKPEQAKVIVNYLAEKFPPKG